mgnify:CR=1 FL=1
MGSDKKLEDKRPSEQVLLDNIGKIAYTLDRSYMARLEKDYGVLYFDEKYNQNKEISYSSNIRAVKVDKWLYDKEQEPAECFKNLLSTFADGDHTIALVVRRTPAKSEMYFVVKNEGKGRNNESRDNVELLNAAIHGNFPGTHTEIIKDIETIQKLFSNDTIIEVDGQKVHQVNSVALFANTPSQYSEKYVTQGLDKLLNGIVPKTEKDSYTIVFLAESVSQVNTREIMSGYEEIASAIHPFAQYQFQMGASEVETNGEMSSISNGTSTTNSVFKTHSVNIGANGGISNSHTDSVTKDKRPVTKLAFGAGGALVGGVAGFFVGGPAGVIAGAEAGYKVGGKVGEATNAVQAATGAFTTASDTSGRNAGVGFGYGYSWGTSKSVTNSITSTEGKSHSIALGNSSNTTYTYKSYMVTNLIKRLENTMERINISQATGLWKYSTYVMAYDSTTSKSVANFLKGITQGKESYLEPTVVQEWQRIEGSSCAFTEIKKYVSLFCHPVFMTATEEQKNVMMVTPTAYVGTNELSNVIAFPKKSLQGIPVVSGVSFGREPYSLTPLKKNLLIGNAYNLHEKIDNQEILLSVSELSKHTFITGSTGSGKSNTIYWLLEQLVKQKKKFLVIEPAKGEYKKMVGQNNNVTVYGTNPLKIDSKLLRINPFSFPVREIHVLEHLDRLVEIFNVCWPMYAAMPAILKDSIERAYIAAGWDLINSENKYSNELFPTFDDVMIQIKQVLNESEYSDDNKGDYIGSLVTRVKSLTNGINGLIFVSDEVPSAQLFDENVVIDLSRIGSSETKSLIMGILVLKLQEYRMLNSNPDSDLSHVTVLEEAHNLLKRTSTEQSSDSSNLLGKSVEMLSNAIAEMRTYGEGFIIADQSPTLLDMSVIRNTNTKIIMRLPDYEDRMLVGKSAGLNDEQIDELSRLEMGVASISQSGWIEPVLCKITDYKEKGDLLKSKRKDIKTYTPIDSKKEEIEQNLMDLLMKKEVYRKCDRTDVENLKKTIILSGLDAVVKCEFLDYLSQNGENALSSLRKLVYDFFDASTAFEKSKDISSNIHEWVSEIVSNLHPSIENYSNQAINLVISLIIYEHARRNIQYRPQLLRFTEEYMMKGRVI